MSQSVRESVRELQTRFIEADPKDDQPKNKYEDYWTDILDDKLGVTLNTCYKILSCGSEYFTSIIHGQWESNELRNLNVRLQEFLRFL